MDTTTRMWLVVLGAVLALVGTIIVQSIVMPITQARVRRHERWEEDVHALSKLLVEELPPLAREYNAALRMALLWHQDRNRKDLDPQMLAEQITAAKATERTTSARLTEMANRQEILVSRLQRLNRKSPFWGTLFARSMQLDVAVHLLTAMAILDLDAGNDEVAAEYKKVTNARAELVKLVEPLATSMRPPSRRTVRRSWQWSKRAAARLTRRAANVEPPPAEVGAGGG